MKSGKKFQSNHLLDIGEFLLPSSVVTKLILISSFGRSQPRARSYENEEEMSVLCVMLGRLVDVGIARAKEIQVDADIAERCNNEKQIEMRDGNV